MIEIDGAQLKLSGPVAIETHVALREDAAPHIGQSDWIVDWSKVTDVDSSALSLIFAWQRMSIAKGKTIRNLNLPPNLKSLAELYSVSEMIAAAELFSESRWTTPL
jgi:phospholipid transport system transporter-binding protein